MGYLPIFVDPTAAKCLVVGGGEVAQRKVSGLLEAGAEVTVISPGLTPLLADHARAVRIRHIRRRYEAGDMAGYLLVYAATDDAQLHRRLFAEARELSIPINVADVPELCTFIMPAIMARGALKIAVSTGGASPAMAKRIVRRLERLFGPEYGLTMEVLRAARRWLRAKEPSVEKRGRKLAALAAARIPDYFRKGEIDAVDRVLLRHLGAGLKELGLNRERLAPAACEETRPAR